MNRQLCGAASWAVGVVAGAALHALSCQAMADSISIGSAQGGRLINGFEMPIKGRRHRFYAPVKSRGSNYATIEMAALLARAAETTERAIPGAPLVIADCSDADGGRLGGHKSHASGRDVDVLFYVRDAKGRSVVSPGFKSFGPDGACSAKKCNLQFDTARNWWFVRTLLASEEPAVQYIFVAEPLKQLMLEFAQARGESGELLKRARRVLMQPPDSSPHADHYHVRIFCSSRDIKAGCVDKGPKWSWRKKLPDFAKSEEATARPEAARRKSSTRP